MARIPVRLAAAGLVLATTVAGLTTTGGAVQAAPPGPPGTVVRSHPSTDGTSPVRGILPPRPGTTLTLLTGDRVVVDGQRLVAIRPAAGRERTVFRRYQADGTTYVVPADVAPLVATGRLDRALFDVTRLAGIARVGDRGATLPLVVDYADDGSGAPLRSALATAGATAVRDLPGARSLAVRVDPAARTRLWSRLRGGSPTTLAAGVTGIRLADTTGPTVAAAAPGGRRTGTSTGKGPAPGVRGGASTQADTGLVELTVRVLDRTGAPAANYYVSLVDVAQQAEYTGYDPTGVVTVRVPTGSYHLEAGVSGDGPVAPFDLFVEPLLTLDDNLTLTLDARDARPLEYTLDRPGSSGTIEITPTRTTDWGSTGATVFGPLEQIRVRPSVTEAPGRFSFLVSAHLGKPDGNGDFYGSPYQYHLRWSEDGRIPTVLDRRFRDSELARTEAYVGVQTPGRWNRKIYSAVVQPPATIVELTSPDAAYFEDVYQMADDNYLDWQIADLPRAAGPAGSVRTERWNVGPFGPAFAGSPDLPFVWCGRVGDQMDFEIPHFSDQNPDHFGFSTGVEQMRMFRNGQPLISQDAAFGIFTVPPGSATYRLETRATRTNSPFSTEVRGAWTFRSEHVPGGPADRAALPLSALRFAPRLNLQNEARAGWMFVLPIYLQPQFGAQVGDLRSIRVEVSYDDGRSWKRVTATTYGNRIVARYNHPNLAGYVSLRATATDTLGNQTELTIIHAYRLKK